MINNLYSFGRIRESHIVELLNKNGKKAVLVENFDEEGNVIPQTYILNGYHKSSPDIEVYDLENETEIILRVEVKSFAELQNNSVRKNGSVLPISIKQFNNYLELFRLSEIPIKVIFVIGRNEPYSYYWEYVDKLNDTPKAVGNHFYDNKKCYFLET